MLHVSTRGEAPAIGFADALLTGLARDGGLYVPEAWPAWVRLAAMLPPDEVGPRRAGPPDGAAA